MTLDGMINLVFSHNALVIIWEESERFSERVCGVGDGTRDSRKIFKPRSKDIRCIWTW